MKKFIRVPFLAAACIAASAFVLSSCGGGSKPKNAADDARASVQKQADAMAKGDLRALFATLPASYQKDVSTVVKTAAGKIDADVYNAASELFVIVAEIGVAQAGFVAEMLSQGDAETSADEVAAASKAFKAFVEKLTLDTLRKGDISAILSAKEITDIAKLAKEVFTPPTITGASANPDGSVTFTMEDDGMEELKNYVKVEGVWVSEEIAENWAGGIKEALEDIAGFTLDAETKDDIMSLFPSLKAGLNNAKDAKSKAQFQMNIIMAAMPFMMIKSYSTSDDGDMYFD